MKLYIPSEQYFELVKLGYDGDYFGAGTLILYQSAFSWFRDKHKLYHSITNHHSHKDFYRFNFLYVIDFNLLGSLDKELKPIYLFEKYVDAELACLIELIKIVKNEQTRSVN